MVPCLTAQLPIGSLSNDDDDADAENEWIYILQAKFTIV